VFYVYILRSLEFPGQIYTGCTDDIQKRLLEHNSGKSAHTKRWMPWELQFYAVFTTKTAAYAFERYLKTPSGRAFAKKHFINTY